MCKFDVTSLIKALKIYLVRLKHKGTRRHLKAQTKRGGSEK